MSSHSHSFDSAFIFFFNDPATTEIYTLSLHDALPISSHSATRSSHNHHLELSYHRRTRRARSVFQRLALPTAEHAARSDRKSTRLNSSHVKISYAVFCLKKKKKQKDKNN